MCVLYEFDHTRCVGGGAYGLAASLSGYHVLTNGSSSRLSSQIDHQSLGIRNRIWLFGNLSRWNTQETNEMFRVRKQPRLELSDSNSELH